MNNNIFKILADIHNPSKGYRSDQKENGPQTIIDVHSIKQFLIMDILRENRDMKIKRLESQLIEQQIGKLASPISRTLSI